MTDSCQLISGTMNIKTDIGGIIDEEYEYEILPKLWYAHGQYR